MYIRKIVDENIGPIKNINISFAFNSDGTPKPIVLVGENGSGKSTLLSNIVDAFYEIAGKAFDNAWETTENGGHQYYKAISTSQITVGNEYMYSYISFDDEKTINYVLKSGKLSTDNFTVLSGYAANSGISWEENENYKNVDIEEKKSKNIYNKDVICFFVLIDMKSLIGWEKNIIYHLNMNIFLYMKNGPDNCKIQSLLKMLQLRICNG